MDHTGRVRHFKAVKDAQRQLHRQLGRHRLLASQALGQRAPGHVLEDHVGLSTLGVSLEDGNDIGMRQAADRARLIEPFIDR